MLPLCSLLAFALAAAPRHLQLDRLLARVAEEAEIFRQAALNLIARETLRQRALSQPPRFRPRIGKPPRKPTPLDYRTREIVSEYAFGLLRESPDVLHEFRQVVSVDGRPVGDPPRARRRLIAGLRSPDDRARQQLLEAFARYTLRSAATDLGLALLAFTPRRLADFRFEPAGHERVGAEPALLLRFRQIAGVGGWTVFENRQLTRHPLQGQLWVRENDALPLRILLTNRRQQDDQEVLDTAVVDYAPTAHGVLVPVSVVRRLAAGDLLIEEDVFQYSDYRMFAADAELKFP